jgi:hypothetical protein
MRVRIEGEDGAAPTLTPSPRVADDVRRGLTSDRNIEGHEKNSQEKILSIVIFVQARRAFVVTRTR